MMQQKNIKMDGLCTIGKEEMEAFTTGVRINNNPKLVQKVEILDNSPSPFAKKENKVKNIAPKFSSVPHSRRDTSNRNSNITTPLANLPRIPPTNAATGILDS